MWSCDQILVGYSSIFMTEIIICQIIYEFVQKADFEGWPWFNVKYRFHYWIACSVELACIVTVIILENTFGNIKINCFYLRGNRVGEIALLSLHVCRCSTLACGRLQNPDNPQTAMKWHIFYLVEENKYAGINHPMIQKNPKKLLLIRMLTQRVEK